MMILGILCFVYYGSIVLYSKRWNSTFSRFWLLAGTGFLFLSFFMEKYERLRAAVYVGILIFLLIFLVVEIQIVLAMIPGKERNLPYILVLGARVMGTKVSDSLKRRLDRAVQYMMDNPETIAVVSGGQGPGEDVTEAQAMKEYMVYKGIQGERILMEDRSMTTKENFQFSKSFAGNGKEAVGIISNNFHMYRACAYAKRAGYENVKRIPADCHPVLFVNYIVREFFAVLKLWISL